MSVENQSITHVVINIESGLNVMYITKIRIASQRKKRVFYMDYLENGLNPSCLQNVVS